ncbi:MAG: hypothetical protein ACTH34_05845 [Microbacterium gubbeenense]|uniref:hypothetical protein n=1 Tax=Microbacterium gubbeenense TaxID=159896 RepID=UPI003F954EEB
MDVILETNFTAPGLPVGAQLIASDDFNRTVIGATPVGDIPWTFSGSMAAPALDGSWFRTGNATEAGNAYGACLINVAETELSYSVDVVQLDTSGMSLPQPILGTRCLNALNGVLVFIDSLGEYSIYSRNSGSNSSGVKLVPRTAAVGDRLTLESIGNVTTLYVNGAATCTISSAGTSTYTRVGFFAAGTTAQRSGIAYDNLSVTTAGV